jgi:palmitoyltransferase
MIFFYIQTILTDPGFVVKNWETEDISFNLQSQLSEFDSNFLPREIKKTYCKICEFYRPQRAHHCKTCGKCVLKMYHHCYWTYNCIGLNNQKFYYLFLFYGIIFNFLSFLCLIYSLLKTRFNFEVFIDKSQKIDIAKHIIFPLIFILSIFLSFLICSIFAFLFIRETIYLLNNFTTIENRIFSSYKDSPFYYKNYFINFKNVMGSKWYEWFLPSFNINIYNHGYFFVNPSKLIETKIDINETNKNSIKINNSKLELFENKFSFNDNNNDKGKKGYFELNDIKDF